MKKYTVLSLGLLVLAGVSVANDQISVDSPEYAQYLADIFIKKGAQKLSQVIEKEVPEQDREKISLKLAGEAIVQAMELSQKDQGQCFIIRLASKGCGSVQDRTKIVQVVQEASKIFKLKDSDVFASMRFDGDERKVVFKGDVVVDVEGYEWQNAQERYQVLAALNSLVRTIKATSDNKSLREILAERDAQNGADKPAQGEQKVQ